MRSRRARIGLIGFGAWGRYHAAAIAKTEGAELVAICDEISESCEAARELYPDAAIFSDYRELLARADVDVVDIVLPNHLHRDVAVAALSAGKHLLLEKPMALSVEECSDVIELARERGRALAIVHEFRLSSLWAKVKEMVDAGAVGEPQYVLVELARNPYRRGEGDWRFDIERVGDWILEEPIHFFDLARWYLSSAGEPQTVYAAANSRQAGHPELQDNFSAILRFEGGEYAVVSQTLGAFEHHHTVKITGSRGALWASWSGALDRTLHPTFFLRAFDGEEVREIPIEKMTGEVYELEDQIAAFVGSLHTGAPLTTTGEDGRWAVGMCVAAVRSVATGRPVRMDEVIPPHLTGAPQ